MKFIVLNVWQGVLGDTLLSFLESKQGVDIFCLQEVLNGGEAELKKFWSMTEGRCWDLLPRIQAALPGHVSFFRPHIGAWAGLAMLVRKEIPVFQEGDTFVFKDAAVYPDDPDFKPPAPRNLQYAKVQMSGRVVTVLNFHGLWSGREKSDTPERLSQSKKIIEFCKSLSGSYVVCGDFNLWPETESMRMLENELRLVNIVRQRGVGSTRTGFYEDREVADYILVTPDIRVADFVVMPDEMSDHAPLYLELE